MKGLLLTVLHLAVMTATLCGPGGGRAVIAENLLLKQPLMVLRRARRRAPNLTLRDRLLCGLGSLDLSPGRIRKATQGARRPPGQGTGTLADLGRRTHRLWVANS